MARLLQYTAKFLKWRAEEGVPPSKDVVEQWGSLYTQLAMCRKVLRFGRPIPLLRDAAATIPFFSANSREGSLFQKEEYARTLENIVLWLNKLALAHYFLLDHVMFFIKIGWYKPNSELTNRLNQLTEGSWLLEALTGLAAALIRLYIIRNNATNELTRADRAKQFRAVVRNGIDIPLILNFLGKTPAWIPHGYFGLCGTVSSAISVWEMWPSPSA